jgi:hypothetical protein
MAVNVANAEPTYFKDSSLNAPLSAWDFSAVWQTTAAYPDLKFHPLPVATPTSDMSLGSSTVTAISTELPLFHGSPFYGSYAAGTVTGGTASLPSPVTPAPMFARLTPPKLAPFTTHGPGRRIHMTMASIVLLSIGGTIIIISIIAYLIANRRGNAV